MKRIVLDTVRKHSNKSEYRNVCRAAYGGLQKVGDGKIVVLLAREMVARGHDPSEPVEVWRDGTICFYATPLQTWADDRFGKVEQPSHLRRKMGAEE